MGSRPSSDHQPHFLPNCLMMVACDRSALYHDRRTRGHATPKSCFHCTHFDRSATALLNVRCNGNLREATKLGTCDTEWVQNSTSTQEYCSTCRSEKRRYMVSPKSVHQRHVGCLCSRWVESPCTRLIVPTGQLKWTRGGCALITPRQVFECMLAT